MAQLNETRTDTVTGYTLPTDALKQLTALGIGVERPDPEHVLLSWQGMRHRLAILTQLRPGLPPGSMAEQAAGTSREPVLFAAVHVSSRLAERLRDEGLHYVDLAGNASIRLPGMLVEVAGRPRVADFDSVATSPMFRRSGVKTLLALLAMPDIATGWTVRELSDAAGVSVGSAQATLKDLRQAGFLTDDGLARGAQLFDRWVAACLADRALRRPVKRYDFRSAWWEGSRESFISAGAALGGESAAEAMGLALRGTTGVLYASTSAAPVVKATRIRQSADGAIEQRHKWWRFGDDDWLAPSPLLYADLIASDDARQREAADELRRSDAVLRRLDAR